MKVLKKIHLKSVSEFLSDQEMKSVVGGVTYSGGYVINGGSGQGWNQGSCGVNVTCSNGSRVQSYRNMSKDVARSQQAAFYQDPDAIAYYSNLCGNYSVGAYWCCDSCN